MCPYPSLQTLKSKNNIETQQSWYIYNKKSVTICPT